MGMQPCCLLSPGNILLILDASGWLSGTVYLHGITSLATSRHFWIVFKWCELGTAAQVGLPTGISPGHWQNLTRPSTTKSQPHQFLITPHFTLIRNLALKGCWFHTFSCATIVIWNWTRLARNAKVSAWAKAWFFSYIVSWLWQA